MAALGASLLSKRVLVLVPCCAVCCPRARVPENQDAGGHRPKYPPSHFCYAPKSVEAIVIRRNEDPIVLGQRTRSGIDSKAKVTSA